MCTLISVVKCTNQVLDSCFFVVFFLLFFWKFKKGESFLKLKSHVDSADPDQTPHKCNTGAPRGFGDLGRMAIYFQGAGEHW